MSKYYILESCESVVIGPEGACTHLLFPCVCDPDQVFKRLFGQMNRILLNTYLTVTNL